MTREQRKQNKQERYHIIIQDPFIYTLGVEGHMDLDRRFRNGFFSLVGQVLATNPNPHGQGQCLDLFNNRGNPLYRSDPAEDENVDRISVELSDVAAQILRIANGDYVAVFANKSTGTVHGAFNSTIGIGFMDDHFIGNGRY
ncbi:MAG: hypothetical protein ABII01_04450 [Candidatus Woesearchaeota archaeon]